MNTTPKQNDPERGDVYNDGRSDTRMQMLLYGDQVVVLRLNTESRHKDGYVHRLARRTEFDKNVDAGRYEYLPDSDLDLLGQTTTDWTEVPYVGEKTAQNLIDAGFESSVDVVQASDSELLAVDGLGQAGLENLKEFAQ